MQNFASYLISNRVVLEDTFLSKLFAELSQLKDKKVSILIDGTEQEVKFGKFSCDLVEDFDSYQTITFMVVVKFEPTGTTVLEQANQILKFMLSDSLQARFLGSSSLRNKAFVFIAKENVPFIKRSTVSIMVFRSRDDLTTFVLERKVIPALKKADLSIPSILLLD